MMNNTVTSLQENLVTWYLHPWNCAAWIPWTLSGRCTLGTVLRGCPVLSVGVNTSACTRSYNTSSYICINDKWTSYVASSITLL